MTILKYGAIAMLMMLTAQPAVHAQQEHEAPSPVQVTLLHEWQAHEGNLWDLVFHSNQNILYTVGENLRDGHNISRHFIESAALRSEIIELQNFPDQITPSRLEVFNEDGNIALLTNGGVYVWELVTGALTTRLQQAFAFNMAVYSSNRLLVLSREPGFFGVWTVRTSSFATGSSGSDNIVPSTPPQLTSVGQIDSELFDLVYAPHMNKLFLVTESGQLYFSEPISEYEINTINPVQPFAEVEGAVGPYGRRTLAVHSQDFWVAYADQDGNVTLYDEASNRIRYTYPMDAPIACIDAGNETDILLIVESSFTPTISLVDTATRDTLVRLTLNEPVISCAFNYDDSLLAIGSVAGNVYVWQVEYISD